MALNTNHSESTRAVRASGHPPTLLPDALVRDLMAAGQADVLIGIPTLNHAETVGRVARTVHELFSTTYARLRTVLINPDGGSSDGTQAAILGCGAPAGELVVTSFGLRTLHRITTPYHGVPGRGSATRLIFAAADLLNARALAVISPELSELTVQDLANLLAPVLDAGADYVKPALPRAPEDGPLVTQLVRPLLSAVFGARVLEPIDPVLACSRGFARRALQSQGWDTPYAQYGLDAWLGALAALEGFHLAQSRLHTQHASLRGQGELSEVFRQVVGSVFGVIAAESARWRAVTQVREVPTFGDVIAPAPSALRFDVDAYAQASREGVEALQPVLKDVLRAQTLASLQTGCQSAGIDEALWVRIVYEFVTSAGRATLPVDQLAQALLPIYLGRLATFLQQLSAQPALEGGSDPHAPLADTFERLRPELVASWPDSARG